MIKNLLASLVAFNIFTLAAFAEEFTIDAEGNFKKGDFSIQVQPQGSLVLAGGEKQRELGVWGCIVDLPGALTSSATEKIHFLSLKRSVDPEKKTLTIDGSFKTPENVTVIYRQTLSAVKDGVKVSCSFTYPNGKGALAAIGRTPFGMMILPGKEFAGGRIKCTATNGQEISSKVPVAPLSVKFAQRLQSEGLRLKSLAIWPKNSSSGIAVAIDWNNLISLEDYRKTNGTLRLVTRSGKEEPFFSMIISDAQTEITSTCALENVTFPKKETYIFPDTAPRIIKLKTTNNTENKIDATLNWKLQNWPEKRILESGEKKVSLSGGTQEISSVELKTKRCGIYRFSASLQAGKTVFDKINFPMSLCVGVPGENKISARSPFGFHGNYFDALSRLGVKWLRPFTGSAGWNKVESEKGKYNWKPIDEIVENTNRHGMNFIFTLWGIPEWASSLRGITYEDMISKYSGNPKSFNIMLNCAGGYKRLKRAFMSKELHIKTIPRDWQDYRNYITKLLERYKGRITYLEVGNEVDGLNHFFGSPKEYVQLLKETWETAKKIDPKIKILGVASWTYRLTDFTKAVFEAGGLNYMDIYAAHFYIHTKYPDYGSPETANIAENLAAIRAEMKKCGKVVPIWNTEWGWMVPPKVDGFPMSGKYLEQALQETREGHPPSQFFTVSNYLNLLVPEDVQAKYLLKFYIIALSAGVEKFFVHTPYGFFYPLKPSEPYVSAAVQAKLSSVLSNARFFRKIHCASPHFQGYLFAAKSRNIAICWTTAEEESIMLGPVDKSVKIFDRFGNPVKANFKDNMLLLQLTDSPVYLENVPGNIKPKEPIKNFAIDWPSAVFAGEKCKMEISLENNLDIPLRANLKSDFSEKWKTDFQDAEFSLSPHEKIKTHLTLNVPRAPMPGVREMKIELHCENEDIKTSKILNGHFNVCMPTPSSPSPKDFKLDGDLSEWKNREPLRMNNAEQIKWQTDDLLSQFEKLWKGKNDLSAKVWVTWNDRDLIIAAQVKDDNVKAYKTLSNREFQGDCVEIFLDGRTKSYAKEYSKGVYQMLWVPPENENETGRIVEGKKCPLGCKAVGRKTQDGYNLEITVPLSKENFPEFSPTKDSVMGFDIAIDDLDAGMGTTRKLQFVLNGTAENFKDTSHFCKLRFQNDVYLKNPIENGNFKENSKGWQIKNGQISELEGKKCLKLVRNGKSASQACQKINLKADQWYELDFLYSESGNAGWSYIDISWEDNTVDFKMPKYFLDSANSQTWHSGKHCFYSGPGGKAVLRIVFHKNKKEGDVGSDNSASLSVTALKLKPVKQGLPDVSLLENGDFEEGSVGFVPPGWTRNSPKKGIPLAKLTDKNVFKGNKALEIITGDAQEINGLDTFIGQAGARYFEPGKTYRLSFYGKSSRPTKICGAFTGGIVSYKNFNLLNKWNKYELIFKLPNLEHKEKCRIPGRITFEGSLKELPHTLIWIDAVKLEEIQEAKN